MIIKASITINAAIPESPRVSSNATKFLVTCEPKKQHQVQIEFQQKQKLLLKADLTQ